MSTVRAMPGYISDHGAAGVVIVGTPARVVARRRGRPGWHKPRHGVWEHRSGHIVQHCGHPTANYPYYAVPPGGGMLILEGDGRGFRRLVDAQERVEEIAAAAGGGGA